MEWIEKLQAPGLVLAGLVIYFLFKLLYKMIDLSIGLLQQLTEQRVTLSEVVVLLRQICSSDKHTGG